ncbi:hypothetical protein COBT_002395 [Conglomerata obtusa]
MICNLEEVKKDLTSNILFYKQVNEDYDYGSNECKYTVEDCVYFLDKELSCFRLQNGIKSRRKEISFLIKKGVFLVEAVKFFVNQNINA